MHILRTLRIHASRPAFLPARDTSGFRKPALVRVAVAMALLIVSVPTANAQGGQSSTTPPPASTMSKKIADREDPLVFLLERKKLLTIDSPLEDSLKRFRKEMQRLQEVVFKDLDKAATRKERGQLPGPTMIATLTKESESRVKDIQNAYRDRARLLLNDRQRTVVDSLEGVWKRSNTKADSVAGKRPPPSTR